MCAQKRVFNQQSDFYTNKPNWFKNQMSGRLSTSWGMIHLNTYMAIQYLHFILRIKTLFLPLSLAFIVVNEHDPTLVTGAVFPKADNKKHVITTEPLTSSHLIWVQYSKVQEQFLMDHCGPEITTLFPWKSFQMLCVTSQVVLAASKEGNVIYDGYMFCIKSYNAAFI